MMRPIFKRLRSDRADSELVSLLIAIPLIVVLLLTIIDVSVYYVNRSSIQGIARDGARSVAIVGGNGKGTEGTQLQQAYAKSAKEVCNAPIALKKYDNSGALANGGTTTVATSPVTKVAYSKSAPSAIECSVMTSFIKNGISAAELNSVECSPEVTNSIGQIVQCEIKWTYIGMPTAVHLITPMYKESVSVGTAESEVNLASSTGGR